MFFWFSRPYEKTIQDALVSIQDNLGKITEENKFVYESITKFYNNGYYEGLNDEKLYNIYNEFEKSIIDICIEYLNSIIRIRKEEEYNMDKEDVIKMDQLKTLKEAYFEFEKSQKKIVYDYKMNMKHIGKRSEFERKNAEFISDPESIPKFIYQDGTISDKLNIDLINEYPGSYYYEEYHSERRTEDGDIYIDYDHDNEDLLIKYMEDNDELLKDMDKMDCVTQYKFINDLDFFELPVKSQYISSLVRNDAGRTIESWRKRKIVEVNGKWLENISNELMKNGKMEEIYNDKLLKEIKYDKKNSYFSIDVEMKYSDIIENYLKNGRKWNNKTLVLKGLKIEDIINEMNKFGINLSDEEKNELEKSWMSVRFVVVNDKYNKSIDDYLKKDHSFIALYLNNMNNEELLNNSLLFVNINMNNVDVIDKYLNNGKEWRKDNLFTRGLKYSDILNDLNVIGLRLNEENKKELRLEWMKLRKIWVNDDYKQSIDRYLKSNDKFIEIYENNISNEKYNAYDDILYVNIKLKYHEAINDYIAHDQQFNIDIIKRTHDYNIDDLNKELQLLGIELSDDEIIELKLSMYSFSRLSKILDKKYDNYLRQWLGDEYEWGCIYRASEHGYTVQSFHEYCDDVGPTLIIIKSYKGWFSGGGYIFGGYTTQSWKVINSNQYGYEYKVDNDAFIFTLYNAHGVLPTRYNALKNSGGIVCASYWGPIFGDKYDFTDICINNDGKNCNEVNSCYTINDGSHGYECDPKYRKSLFVNTAGPNETNYFSVSDYEVFAINFKDLDMLIKVTGYSLEIRGLKIIEKPLISPSELLYGTRIVNSKYDAYLKEWLGNEYKWKCIYRASEHGYTGKSFHQYCDNMGPTLIIIKSRNGYIFGGYTSKSWKAMNPNEKGFELKIDNNAFIFTLYNAHRVVPTRYKALKDIGGISCHAGRGPSFTNNQNTIDIFLNFGGKNCNEMNSCVIYNDGTNGYGCDPKYKKSLFVNTNGSNYPNLFSVSEFEVFAHK